MHARAQQCLRGAVVAVMLLAWLGLPPPMGAQRRRERHHRVEADIIFAAESAGIGQRGGGDELFEFRAGVEPVGQRGQQFVRRRLLHEPHEREPVRLRRPADQVPSLDALKQADLTDLGQSVEDRLRDRRNNGTPDRR